MNPVKVVRKHLPDGTDPSNVSPSRRELLRTCGPALSLAGCLSSGLLSGHPEIREESGQTVERTMSTPLTDEPANSAFATLVVGERSGFHLGEKKPHQVWVRNGTGENGTDENRMSENGADGNRTSENETDESSTAESREMLVEIGASPDADPWFRRTYEFAPDDQLVIELRTSHEYAVSVEAGDATETVEVPESRFDCNDSATDVVVRTGEIETMGITTDGGCPTFERTSSIL